MLMFLEDTLFVAVIGDMKHSRQLNDRREVQDKMKNVLEEINEKFADEIASRFVITLGDEFQGLLRDGKNVLRIIEEIKMKLYPVEIRFGIGIGSISTDINTDIALGADGPGYYMAREAIEIIKENEKKNKAVISDIWLETREDKANRALLVNTVFALLKSIEQKWTKRQREIIWSYMQSQESQQKVADRMGITQSTVHKALKNGNYYVYEKALRNVEQILGELSYDNE